MATATISSIIAQREQIKARKSALYDLETSIGTITCKPPNGSLVAEAWNFDDTFAGNAYLVYNSIVSPDLTSRELQEAFGTAEPLDIVSAIFQAGEVNKIAGKLLDLSGFKGKIASKLHETTKN